MDDYLWFIKHTGKLYRECLCNTRKKHYQKHKVTIEFLVIIRDVRFPAIHVLQANRKYKTVSYSIIGNVSDSGEIIGIFVMRNLKIMSLIAALLVTPISWAGQDTFYDFNSKPAKLQTYLGNGKWTVVMIWASDCLICNKEAPAYEKFHVKHQNKNTTFLGISMDGLKQLRDAKAFVKEHKVTFPNLIADPETVAGLYNEQTGDTWYGTPTFLIYSPEGKLRAAQSGAVPPKVIEDYISKNSK